MITEPAGYLPKSPSLTLQAFSLDTLYSQTHTLHFTVAYFNDHWAPTMQYNQQKGIFHFIQFLMLFFMIHIQLHQNGIALEIEETDTSSSSSSSMNNLITHNDDEELQALMVQLAQPKPRSCWV